MAITVKPKRLNLDQIFGQMSKINAGQNRYLYFL